MTTNENLVIAVIMSTVLLTMTKQIAIRRRVTLCFLKEKLMDSPKWKLVSKDIWEYDNKEKGGAVRLQLGWICRLYVRHAVSKEWKLVDFCWFSSLRFNSRKIKLGHFTLPL